MLAFSQFVNKEKGQDEPEKDSLRSKFLWISLYLVMKFDGKYTYEVKYVGQSIY